MTSALCESGPAVKAVRRLAEAWNRFWFNPADPTTLGLIRICCGFMLLYVHLAYTYDLRSFFGPNAWIDAQMIDAFRKEGPVAGLTSDWEEPVPLAAANPEEAAYMKKWALNPRQVTAKGHYFWSIWYYVTDPFWMQVIHGSILTVMFLFMIGFCTRVSSVLTWIGLVSYIQRAPNALFGMDAIMNVVVIYLMIGPSGAALSVDRLISRYWATYRALRKHQPVPELVRPAPRVSANLALRLLQVHVCFIYAASGLSKLQGAVWWNGNAVWSTMANYEFSPMSFKLYMDALRLISEHRWLWELVMTGGTYFTLFFEISFAFLVWNRRLRWLMVTSAVLLHLGIAVCMGLVTFSLMMLIAVLAFIPAQAVRELLWRLGRGRAGLRFVQLEGCGDGGEQRNVAERPVRVAAGVP